MSSREGDRQADTLLQTYLGADDDTASEKLLTELLALARPLIERRLGYRFRVSIRNGRSPHSPDAEDQCSEATISLLQKLRRLKASRSQESIRDFRTYVEGIAENIFRDRLRQDHRELRSLKDSLRYLLDGRHRQNVFALWQSENGQQVAGLAEWRNAKRPLIRTSAYQQLIDDPLAKFPRRNARQMGRAELVGAIFRFVGSPIELRDLVTIVATLLQITNNVPPSLGSIPGNEQSDITPDWAPTPSDVLQTKSDTEMVWQDLRRLSLEQRRVLLLQSQHDVIEILLRAGAATIQEIASTVEMSVEELESLRCEGFLSDERLSHRFRSLKSTIMQQRHRARRRMAEWRKRW